MYRVDLARLKQIDQFKDLLIDIDKLCRVIKEESYTKKLLVGDSYCKKNIDKELYNTLDPYNVFEKYIISNKQVPMLIIGCSGVGKSSFIKHYKKDKTRFIRFNLNKRNEPGFSVKNIHIYLFDKLVSLINNEFGVCAPIKLYQALMHTDGMFLHHYGMEEYELSAKGLKYRTEILINCFDKCKESIFARDDLNQLKSINKSMLSLLLKDKKHNDNREIVFAIDNLDRTSSISYERKLFSSGLLDISADYLPIKGVKIIVALRRVTFIRHLEGKERLKTWAPEIIYLTPPNPINLLASKILHKDYLYNDTSDTLYTYNNIKVTGRGKNLFIFVIYLCLLLQKRDKNTIDGNLLVAVCNESAREMIRMILTISLDDYTSIQEFNTVRTVKLLNSANEIFESISSKESFQEVLSWIYGEKEIIPEDIIDTLLVDIYSQIFTNHFRYALTDYHLFSMFIRFGYNRYNQKQEGNTTDINILLQICSQSKEIICKNHTSHYPMPLLNVFENRNDHNNYNNIVRFIMLRILADKSLTPQDVEDCLLSISIDKSVVDDVIDIFKYKYYIIGENFELVDNKPIPVMLTRKGQLLYTVTTWPRYINNIINATNICVVEGITSCFDTEFTNIINFFMLVRKYEINFFNQMSGDQKKRYNMLFNDTQGYHPIASVFSKRYFSFLLYELNAMIVHIHKNDGEEVFAEIQNEFLLFLADKFGYFADDILSIDTSARFL